MRSAFALGMMALAMAIPLCAQQGQQDAKKARAVIPPLVFLSGSATIKPLDPHAKVFSSGIAIELPPMAVPSASTTTELPVPHAKVFSSGIVIELPDFARVPAAK